jgi:phosphatidylglycerophosphate synthase
MTDPGTLSTGALLRSRKRRQGTALLSEHVFRPLAHAVVLVLAPLRVPPPAVVVAAGCTGLTAALALARGHLLVAALLLQAKIVLDNADGQLARLTGRVSALGRYLDSESDLLVNADVTVLANLGLSTQLAVLGVCLAVGRPAAYAWFAVTCAFLLVPLGLRRELRLRRALAQSASPTRRY